MAPGDACLAQAQQTRAAHHRPAYHSLTAAVSIVMPSKKNFERVELLLEPQGKPYFENFIYRTIPKGSSR